MELLTATGRIKINTTAETVIQSSLVRSAFNEVMGQDLRVQGLLILTTSTQ